MTEQEAEAIAGKLQDDWEGTGFPEYCTCPQSPTLQAMIARALREAYERGKQDSTGECR